MLINTSTHERVASLPTGANPLSAALSPDGKRLYITNSGLFEYQAIPGVESNDLLNTGLHFTAFGYPSRAAREGATVEGLPVPGLGAENDVRGSSLWTYDVSSPTPAHLLAKLRLGETISKDSATPTKLAIGGAAPTGVVANADRVYVSLAHQDSVAVVTADGTRQLQEIPLSPFRGSRFLDSRGHELRGVMPAGLALHGNRLFVTEAGINAVAVVDTVSNKVLGHLPVGWYPSAAAVSADGRRLFVVNTKGREAGSNGGDAFLPDNGAGSYIGEPEYGSVSMIPLEADMPLLQLTQAVVANNLAALAADSALPKLKHVFLIVRENRPFVEIFGDLPGADGDPKLARWGLHGWLESSPNDKSVAVTPNAHALDGYTNQPCVRIGRRSLPSRIQPWSTPFGAWRA